MKLNKIWKRTLTTIGILGLGVALTACGSSSSSKSSSSDKVSSELTNKGSLTVGLEGTYAPYSYRKDGKLTGFEVDLATKIAKKINLKPKFVTTKWDGLIAGLGSNKYDVVMNDITITPERQQSFRFSTPYIYSRSVLVTSSKKPITNIKNIKGKQFAEGTGTNNETVAKKYGAKITPSEQFATSLDLINQGRVEGTINSIDAWNAYAKDHSTKGLKAVTIPDSQREPAKIATLINKNDSALQKKITKAINELRQSGELQALSKKYFGTDITHN